MPRLVERRLHGREPGPRSPARRFERDLVAHLRRWARHVPKHGLVVLEAHCAAPKIVGRNLGSLHGIAFDAHQAYSKQYPVDHPAFLECCRQAGLRPVGHRERRYPASRTFVAVSLNRLLAASEETPLPAMAPGALVPTTGDRTPRVDLEDGEALHRILFREGDIRYPATWCSAPTGFVVAGTLEAIEARLDRIGEDEAIWILDYGAGTGTATIELLKACRERGIERPARPPRGLARGPPGRPSLELVRAGLRAAARLRLDSLPLPSRRGGRLQAAERRSRRCRRRRRDGQHGLPPDPPTCPRALDGRLANALAPGGRLLWSAPDLGLPDPLGTSARSQRVLRERWWSSRCGRQPPVTATGRPHRASRRPFDALARISMGTPCAKPRIVPIAESGPVLRHRRRRGARRTLLGRDRARRYEMLDEDVVRGLLVPSNQAEFLPEIPDGELREQGSGS